MTDPSTLMVLALIAAVARVLVIVVQTRADVIRARTERIVAERSKRLPKRDA